MLHCVILVIMAGAIPQKYTEVKKSCTTQKIFSFEYGNIQIPFKLCLYWRRLQARKQDIKQSVKHDKRKKGTWGQNRTCKRLHIFKQEI